MLTVLIDGFPGYAAMRLYNKVHRDMKTEFKFVPCWFPQSC